MLLDSYVLKKSFEELLNLANPVSAPPAGYIKRVSHSMSKLDPLLKTLQVRPSPPEALIQAYLIHIADKSDVNFRKILDLKGIRKQEQTHLVDIFHAHCNSPPNEHLTQSSAYLSLLVVSGGGGGTNLASGISSLSHATNLGAPNLPNRFDPSTFGNAIMTAARDGVDRFGSPALGGGGFSYASGATTPSQQHSGEGNSLAAGNLKNIGKFFKRDLGSFGGRFGGGAKGVEEGG